MSKLPYHSSVLFAMFLLVFRKFLDSVVSLALKTFRTLISRWWEWGRELVGGWSGWVE